MSTETPDPQPSATETPTFPDPQPDRGVQDPTEVDEDTEPDKGRRGH